MNLLRALLHEDHWRPRWRGLFLLLVAVVAWFAFVPDGRAPDPTGYDKTNHMLAFGVLAYVGALAAWGPRWALVAGLVGYGVFIEVVQSFLPTRHGDVADVVADALGIALGLCVVALSRRLSR